MNAKQTYGVTVALCVAALAARADSLELKNGSLIKGSLTTSQVFRRPSQVTQVV
jgi:hypothetical protein